MSIYSIANCVITPVPMIAAAKLKQDLFLKAMAMRFILINSEESNILTPSLITNSDEIINAKLELYSPDNLTTLDKALIRSWYYDLDITMGKVRVTSSIGALYVKMRNGNPLKLIVPELARLIWNDLAVAEHGPPVNEE